MSQIWAKNSNLTTIEAKTLLALGKFENLRSSHEKANSLFNEVTDLLMFHLFYINSKNLKKYTFRQLKCWKNRPTRKRAC